MERSKADFTVGNIYIFFVLPVFERHGLSSSQSYIHMRSPYKKAVLNDYSGPLCNICMAFYFLGDYFLTTSLKVQYKNLNYPKISPCVAIAFLTPKGDHWYSFPRIFLGTQPQAINVWINILAFPPEYIRNIKPAISP